jgi:ABC-type branched-subunit amino acid transport system substrate-binding protein
VPPEPVGTPRGSQVSASKTLNLARRSQTYLLLVGVVVGMFVAGIAVPLVFGESLNGNSGDQNSSRVDTSKLGADSTGASGAGDTTTTLAGVDASGAPLGGGASGSGSGVRASGTSGGTGTSGATATGTGGPLTATDRGVTDKVIRVGATTLDVATVGRMGVGVAVDPAQQEAAFRAFFEEINARGGINGRKLEYTIQSFDVTNREDQIAVCRRLTKEKQVFAVLGGFNIPDPNACIVEENKTPLVTISNNNPDWLYQRAQGRLFTLYPRSGRMMPAIVAEMERTKLADKKIGILSDRLNDPNSLVAKQLETLLKDHGHNVVYRGELSDQIPEASSQTPVEVNRMRTAGGTGAEVVVFLQSNSIYGTQFVNAANGQNYHPTYVNSDWSSNNGDSVNANMPNSYENDAVAFTFSRILSGKRPYAIPPQHKRCLAAYDKYSGRAPLAQEPNTAYGLTMQYCDNVLLFEKLATLATSNLTRATFSDARNKLGFFDPVNNSAGTLGPDRFDVPELIRTMRWKVEDNGEQCKCWVGVDQFHRPGG